MKKTNTTFLKKVTLLIALLVIGFLASVCFGSTALNFKEFFGGLFFKKEYYTFSVIIYNIRLPRALGAIIAGAGLSASGAILQTITNNRLCGPNIIGVNSGAGVMVVLLTAFLPMYFYLAPIFAFLGAFLTTLLIAFVAKILKGGKSTIILAGICITALFNAVISFLILINDELGISYKYFSIGGLYGVTLEKLVLPLIIVIVCIILTIILSNKIDVLSLGSNMAYSLGVNVKYLRVITLMLSSALAAAVVSFAGLLGFVGLAIPNIAKKVASSKTKELVIISALLGGVLLVFSDLLCRIIFTKTELPLGIITAVLGAPFFFVLLLGGKKDA